MARLSGSTKVVLAALAGNLAVASVKFTAFAFTRSSAMLSEAIHSLVDTCDQLLLLVGERRSARPPDEAHPFGHGMEMYFWSFIVVIVIFLAGGTAAISQGLQRVFHPSELQRPWVSLGVLGASAVFEGFSLRAAYAEYRRVIADAQTTVNVVTFVRASKDPSVFTTLVEDSAAMAGLVMAALGVAGATVLHLPWADGAASIGIGVLLMGVALLLANETRSLIAGEAAAPPIQRRIRAAAEAAMSCGVMHDLTSLQFGPRSIMVFVRAEFAGASADEIDRAAAVLVERIKAVDPRISEVMFRRP
jgi:cation diffusion facilitator family transporter